MYESIKSVLLDLLKAPTDPPEPPRGTHGSLQIFRASPQFLQYQLVWLMVMLGVLGVIFLGIGVGVSFQKPMIGLLLLALFFLLWICIALVGYVTVRLEYDLRYYILTDRSLRVRYGVWSIVEQTLTYANVQNIQVQQGPVERLFGISNLSVETAGGGGVVNPEQGGGGQNYHRAAMRGLDNAEEIKSIVMGYLRRLPTYSGLGDPDDTETRTRGFSKAEIEALREILQALRGINGTPATGEHIA